MTLLRPLGADLYGALQIDRDFAKASRILAKKPWFRERASLNDIRISNGNDTFHLLPLLLWVFEVDVGAVKWALQHGADPNIGDEGRGQRWGRRVEPQLPLSAAITGWSQASDDKREKHIEIIDALLAAGANPNSENALFRTIHVESGGFLSAHAEESRLRLVSALLRAGADPNRPGAHGWSIFRLLALTVGGLGKEAAEARCRLAEVLIAAGAKPQQHAPLGEAPAREAFDVLSESYEILVVLYLAKRLSLDIGLNSQDRDGNSALHCAASRGFPGPLQLLIDAGANAHLRNKAGRTPGEIARITFKNQAKGEYASREDFGQCAEVLANAEASSTND